MLSLMFLISGVSVFIPFIFSRSTLDPVLPVRFLIWAVLTFCLVSLILFKGQKEKTGSFFTRGVFYALGCFLLINAFSLTRAINLGEGIYEWLKIFLASAFFYASSVILGRNDKGIIYLTRSVIICGMLLALIGILQYLGNSFISIPGYYIIYATMANTNLLASGLFLTLPFLLFGIFKLSSLWKITSWISLVIVISAIAMCGTRTVCVAIIISGSAVLPLFIYIHRKKTVDKKYYILGLSVLIIILICPVIVISALRFSFNETSGCAVFSTASFQERKVLWSKTWDMIRERPFLGVGPGQWKIVLPSYGKVEKNIESEEGKFEVLFQRPHNDYLWVLSETGLAGLFFYLAFFMFVISYSLKTVFKHNNSDKKMLSVLMLFGILGYMVIGFFSFPKERPFHLIFLMLIASCIVSTYHCAFSFQKKGYSPKPGQISVLILLAFCIFFGYSRMVSEIHARRALDARNALQWERVIAEIDEADKWFYNMDPSSTPLSWYKGMANFSQGRISDALDDFKRACEINPYHVHALNNAATCFAMSGDSENALEYLKRAIAVSPFIY
ncbi:MAG: O-antigen ligase family protein [Deltaproteobacteria bacterium]|nr:O-antigen ligase family protein [Deltaproteobacteria bacterium]